MTVSLHRFYFVCFTVLLQLEVMLMLLVIIPLSFAENSGLATINIDGKQFQNPCKNSDCPSGTECTIHYTPRLLKIPIAHCVDATSELSSKEGDRYSYKQLGT